MCDDDADARYAGRIIGVSPIEPNFIRQRRIITVHTQCGTGQWRMSPPPMARLPPCTIPRCGSRPPIGPSISAAPARTRSAPACSGRTSSRCPEGHSWCRERSAACRGSGVIWATAAGLDLAPSCRARHQRRHHDRHQPRWCARPQAARPRARDPARRGADRERRRDRRDDHSGTEPLHQPAHSGAGAQPRHADQDTALRASSRRTATAAAAASLPARAARPGDRAHARVCCASP